MPMTTDPTTTPNDHDVPVMVGVSLEPAKPATPSLQRKTKILLVTSLALTAVLVTIGSFGSGLHVGLASSRSSSTPSVATVNVEIASDLPNETDITLEELVAIIVRDLDTNATGALSAEMLAELGMEEDEPASNSLEEIVASLSAPGDGVFEPTPSSHMRSLTSLSSRVSSLRSSNLRSMSTRAILRDYYWPFVRQYGGHGVSWTRFSALRQSLLTIAAAHDGSSTATFDLTVDADLTDDEMVARNGVPTTEPPRRLEQDGAFSFPPPNRTAVAIRRTLTAWSSVDWRTKGIVSSVKSQGSCGSCWAFAAVGLLEAKLAQHTGRAPPDLSEEHVKDCTYRSRPQRDLCNGGWPHAALQAVASFPAQGVTTEAQMPYVARADASSCENDVEASVLPEHSTVVHEWGNTVASMKEAIQKGPMVGVTWWPDKQSLRAFQGYKGGVLTDNDLACAHGRKGKGGGGHAMLIVGFDADDDAFIYKNSWGSWWGDGGYVKIKAGACQSDTHYTTLSPDVQMYGTTYAGCQGKYIKSADTVHGQPVWDRVEPDSSRFIFYCWGRWRITGSQWRDAIVNDESGTCHGSFLSSEPVSPGTPWYQATWVHNAHNTKVGATAEMRGSTYATCQGKYVESSDDTVHGKPVWDRVELNGAPDHSRFIFYCWGRWRITGSQWRDAIVNDKSGRCHGSFITSEPASSDTPWYEAKWSHNTQGASAALII